jgi:hypothetical protein
VEGHWGGDKVNNKSRFKTKLHLLTFTNSSAFFSQKAFEIYKILQKLNIFESNHKNRKCFLFRCPHAIVIMQNKNGPISICCS